MNEDLKIRVRLFLEKMDWEGGLSGALEYGLQPDEDFPEEFKRKWAEVAAALNELEFMIDDLYEQSATEKTLEEHLR